MALFGKNKNTDPEKDALVRTVQQLRNELRKLKDGNGDFPTAPSRHDYSIIGLQDGILKLSPEREIRYINSCLAGLLRVDKAAVTGVLLETADTTELGNGYIGRLVDEAADTDGELTRAETVTVKDVPRHYLIRVRRTAEDIQVVFEDVSEQRKAEMELAEKENQLREAQKMESLGTLAAGVAHDLNNLLTIIRLNLELLGMEADLSEQAGSHFKEINDTVDRSSALTRQLLLFSRRQVMMPEVCDMHGIIDNMLKMLKRIIGEDVELTFTRKEGRGTIRADQGTIEQVVLNLAVNARDAMPGGGRLTIEACETDVPASAVPEGMGNGPGAYVRIRFADTGTGIPGDVRQRIFEPFFTTKEAGKGTGLGLSVVYGIIKEHKGWITVESTPCKGAVFFVYLPVSEESAETGSGAPAGLPAGDGGKTILLIEDEKAVLDAMAGMLRADGHTVITAPTAMDGLMRFEDKKAEVELIMCDVVLPDESGPGIVEKIRQDHPDVPVIFCSAYSDDRSHRAELQEKGFLFLQKPFTRERMREVIRQAAAQDLTGRTCPSIRGPHCRR